MLMLINFLIYIVFMRDDINFRQIFINIFYFKTSSCFMGVVGVRVPVQILQDLPLFRVNPSFKICPNTTCSNTTKSAFSNIDIYIRPNITFSHLLYYFHFYILMSPNELFKQYFVVLFLFFMCAVFCPFLFVFVCCAFCVIGKFSFYSVT
jgi:hypothetical protein